MTSFSLQSCCRTTREILYQLITACPCSENIESCRCRTATGTLTSPLSVLFTFHHFSPYAEHIQSKNRKGNGNSNRARNAGWQAHLRSTKTPKWDLSLLGRLNIKSVPPCFSPYTIFNTVSASLEGRHVMNGHQHWKVLKSGCLHRIPVKLGKASDTGALTMPSLITAHRNRTTTHRGRTLSNL